MQKLIKYILGQSKEVKRTEYRELLRENLNSVAITGLSARDPSLLLTGNAKKEYLKYFNDISKDVRFNDIIDYLVNEQIRLMLLKSNSKEQDDVGSITINGIQLVRDKIKQISNEYERSLVGTDDKNFNPYKL